MFHKLCWKFIRSKGKWGSPSYFFLSPFLLKNDKYLNFFHLDAIDDPSCILFIRFVLICSSKSCMNISSRIILYRFSCYSSQIYLGNNKIKLIIVYSLYWRSILWYPFPQFLINYIFQNISFTLHVALFS